MSTVRVAAGSATGPTAMAAYDAALAAANLHNYNLVPVSSVIPADAAVEAVERAPDLGPAGRRLTVVQAHAAATPSEARHADRIVAGLGWATGPGPGLFYEATGTDPDAVRATVREGLATGRSLREWTFADETVRLEAVETDPEAYTAAVVVAAYGEAEPVF